MDRYSLASKMQLLTKFLDCIESNEQKILEEMFCGAIAPRRKLISITQLKKCYSKMKRRVEEKINDETAISLYLMSIRRIH